MSVLFCVLILPLYAQDALYKASDERVYSIVRRIRRPGDLLFFTEGLSFYDGETLLESTGLYGDSEIHLIEGMGSAEEQKLNVRRQLDKKFFGEGSTRIPGKNGEDLIYMLTYKERKVLVFSADLSQQVAELELPQEINEGWGMTHYFKDGLPYLLVSDGTSRYWSKLA